MLYTPCQIYGHLIRCMVKLASWSILGSPNLHHQSTCTQPRWVGNVVNFDHMFGRICTTITKKINFNQKCLQFSTQSSNTWFLVANNNNAIVFYPLRKIRQGLKACSIVMWYFGCIWTWSCGGHTTCYNQANRGTEIPSSMLSKFTINHQCKEMSKSWEVHSQSCIYLATIISPILVHWSFLGSYL